MIPYFEDLISLAESYHRETGSSRVYGDIGELFGAITYGIKKPTRKALTEDLAMTTSK